MIREITDIYSNTITVKIGDTLILQEIDDETVIIQEKITSIKNPNT